MKYQNYYDLTSYFVWWADSMLKTSVPPSWEIFKNVEIVSHIKDFIVPLIKIPALFYTFPIWTGKG